MSFCCPVVFTHGARVAAILVASWIMLTCVAIRLQVNIVVGNKCLRTIHSSSITRSAVTSSCIFTCSVEQLHIVYLKMTSSLQSMENRVISVITGDGRSIVGLLKVVSVHYLTRFRFQGFDQLINLVLEDAHERVYSENAGVEQIPLGLYIIRGENVYVCPPIRTESIITPCRELTDYLRFLSCHY